tara:strand:+ start:1010 stop:3094 length:2085 start_codon:yes stop_codon:yes gene_type:complete
VPEHGFDAHAALLRGAQRLVELQAADGSWEGETVWNPMLPSQYLIAMAVMGRPVDAARIAGFRKQLEAEQLPDGTFGMHRHGETSLFITGLAYVAARLHGFDADDPLLRGARELFQREDVLAIPTWGKIWLSLAGVYRWEGVNAVPPEVWLLPKQFPLHPANYYCHTRLIYMGMASVFGRKIARSEDALTRALRAELFPGRDWATLDFRGARHRLREGDLWEAPNDPLVALYEGTNLFEKVHPGPLRERMLESFIEPMRFELRTTDATCLSPVNGLLFMLSLWDRARERGETDPDLEAQLAAFEGWIWEDEAEGLRVAGARSATWDSSFALQGLTEAVEQTADPGLTRALALGLRWLETQQVAGPIPPYSVADYRAHDRVDPTGGFCFAGVWHGWPVSDCTAEALEAFLHAPERLHQAPRRVIERAVRFLLQAQNPDGGFGSYEARKQRFELEWINPAEMFGDSMTELSYVECTASNVSALGAVRAHHPGLMRREVDLAIAKGEGLLRARQRPDGSWEGVWGVASTYGTLFAIRGLRAAGAPPEDPAIRRGVEFLLRHRRPDGAWGEHWKTCLIRDESAEHYIQLGEGHPTQTAWALLALLFAYAGHEERTPSEVVSALREGARWLAGSQEPDGDWPSPLAAGVFFRTALLDYRLYRRIFPVQALALYERWRARRGETAPSRTRPAAPLRNATP